MAFCRIWDHVDDNKPFFALDKRFVYLSKDHSIVKPLESAWMFPMLKYIRQSMIHMEEFTCTGISDMAFRFHYVKG